jgi:hypothetical protein
VLAPGGLAGLGRLVGPGRRFGLDPAVFSSIETTSTFSGGSIYSPQISPSSYGGTFVK